MFRHKKFWLVNIKNYRFLQKKKLYNTAFYELSHIYRERPFFQTCTYYTKPSTYYTKPSKQFKTWRNFWKYRTYNTALIVHCKLLAIG